MAACRLFRTLPPANMAHGGAAVACTHGTLVRRPVLSGSLAMAVPEGLQGFVQRAEALKRLAEEFIAEARELQKLAKALLAELKGNHEGETTEAPAS